MSLLNVLGPHTVSRLEKAAARRRTEAEYLAEGGHRLAAIYFYGYVVEMVLGAAYFKVLGYGATAPIEDQRLKRVLNLARDLSKARDRSHPVDGWAVLLVNDKKELSPPPYEAKMGDTIIEKASQLCDHWGPTLRYRAIEATLEQLAAVRESAEWFLKTYPKL